MIFNAEYTILTRFYTPGPGPGKAMHKMTSDSTPRILITMYACQY